MERMCNVYVVTDYYACYCYYIRVTAFSPEQPGWSKRWRVAVDSAGPYANHLYLAPDR